MLYPPPRVTRGGPAWCFLTLATLSTAIASTPLSDVQTAAAEWARLRAETTRLEKEWTSEKEVLRASTQGLEVRAGQLQAERDTLLADSAKARAEIAAKTAENTHTAERITEADQRIRQLATKLLALRPALPPRLSSALDLPYRSLAGTDVPPAERMKTAMAILNRCNQFNQTFVLSEEILPVTPGGEPRLLEIIYWGLAQACALDRAGGEAFVGRPVNGQWTWQPQPGLADEAARLIAIHQDKAAPDFVALPVQTKGGAQ